VDEVSGTSGLTGAADATLVLKHPRHSPDATLEITGRDVEEQELAMQWDKARLHWELVGPATHGPAAPSQVKVVEFLAKGPATITQIAQALGKADEKGEAAVRQLLQRMKENGKVIKVKGTPKYALPEVDFIIPFPSHPSQSHNESEASSPQQLADACDGVTGVTAPVTEEPPAADPPQAAEPSSHCPERSSAYREAMAKVDLAAVEPLAVDASIPFKEQARLLRDLLRRLAVPHVSVTTPHHANASAVLVHLPVRDQTPEERREAFAAFEKLLERAFPTTLRWWVRTDNG
jgi:hypothetical protein